MNLTINKLIVNKLIVMDIQQVYECIVKYGKYYNPASKHYQNVTSNPNVQCDRCKRTNLSVCIGWEKHDRM